MTEKEMRQFVECGLAREDEYELLKTIMADVDYDDEDARLFACLTFFYRAGGFSKEEYKSSELYQKAKGLRQSDAEGGNGLSSAYEGTGGSPSATKKPQ